MAGKTPKLHKSKLNQIFVDGLGCAVESFVNIGAYPLLLDLRYPYPLRLRVYLFNCTNPPGGRALDEYKIQVILPGQKSRCRASLDYSDGRMPILAAFTTIDGNPENGVFVMWDADKHIDFAYSANVQVKAETIIGALCDPVAESTRNNDEIVLAARPKHLMEALRRRVTIAEDNIRKEVDGIEA